MLSYGCGIVSRIITQPINITCKYFSISETLCTTLQSVFDFIFVLSDDEPIYCAFTIIFTIVPTFLAIFVAIIEIYYSDAYCNDEKSSATYKIFIRILECFLHLPVLQLFCNFHFFRQLKSAAKNVEKVDGFAFRIDEWIKNCEALKENDEWGWERIKVTFSGKILNDDADILKEIFTKRCPDRCFNGVASEKLEEMIDAEKIELRSNLAEVNSRIKEFKVLEAFGESAPQFVLQACIIIHKKGDFIPSNLEPFQILTLISSYLSVIYTVTTTFLKMPFIIDGRREAPFSCLKNYLIVIPLMTSVVTQRLISLTMLFASFRQALI